MNLDELKKLYFLGIGGIGMSALARYFNSRSCEIHGYDKTETTLTKKLVAEGMKIHYEENPALLPPDIDLVVWTPAVPRDNLELQFFNQSGIPVKKRAEVLGLISRSHRTIAVAGTHGKTTTSTLVAHLLHTAGISCTAFLGGISKNFGSNFVEGGSDWVVAEADEYDRSFLQLAPKIAVLMSMDPDHLDIYGDAKQIEETGFKEFLRRVKPGGKIFLKSGLEQSFENMAFETFGVEAGQYRAENLRVENGWFIFDLVAPAFHLRAQAIPVAARSTVENRIHEEVRWKGLRFTMPGRHNVENACAAIAAAMQAGAGEEAVRKGLANFKGIVRRFEMVYRDEQHVFIDDYAHHPTEIHSAVQAARELFPGRKITGIFQPHLYSRTRDFQDGFARELDKLDEIILMDIYPARERPIPGISSEVIFEKMKNPDKVLVTKANMLEVLKSKDLDVLMTIGAGDIDTFVEPIKRWLMKR
ncbi:MAG: UDP-N-acetylmuramate--L-alanine ligase [Saprospiraceae bacterium]|nr:MAG: UDP-N-acetylmuramate--L-alanine ligase [Saprospiraceae bacterium]